MAKYTIDIDEVITKHHEVVIEHNMGSEIEGYLGNALGNYESIGEILEDLRFEGFKVISLQEQSEDTEIEIYL